MSKVPLSVASPEAQLLSVSTAQKQQPCQHLQHVTTKTHFQLWVRYQTENFQCKLCIQHSGLSSPNVNPKVLQLCNSPPNMAGSALLTLQPTSTLSTSPVDKWSHQLAPNPEALYHLAPSLQQGQLKRVLGALSRQMRTTQTHAL